MNCWLSFIIITQFLFFKEYVPCFCFVFYSIAYVEFKTEADAERTMEETQGSEVQGRSIIIDYTGEKSHMGARASGKLEIFCRTVRQATCNKQFQ